MNKTLKKTLSIILTILMIVTAIPMAFAAEIVGSGECGADGDNLTWTLDADGTLTISGEGAMADYHVSTLPPWAGYKENIKEIVIEEGVTELGRFAFYGHTAVKDVSIANSVTTFTGRVFDGCSAIEKLIIPAGVSILESTSFQNCSSLKQIVFLGKVDIDNFYAFDGCSELREIVFAKGATNSQDVSYPFTIDDINADEIVIHFGGTQAEADEAFAPISEMDKIYSVATIHYMDGCNCSDCDFALAHSGGTATCIDLAVCQVCETVYGEVDADAHDWSNKDGVCANACGFECPHEGQNGSCKNCGANLGKLVIDLSEVTLSGVSIGNGYKYYDEDGYIITGENKNIRILIYDSCDITFNNMSAHRVDLYSETEDNIPVTLDGDNYIYGFNNPYMSHLTINGDDDDTLTIVNNESAITTVGNPGSLTVNGGKINAVTETTYDYPTINCFGGFTLNGGEVTASNNYDNVIYCNTVINGGTLNVISTSHDMEAIVGDIEIAKGALLTVSATYMVFDTYYNITPVNEAEENLSVFARFDKDSDFSIVSDIKAAIKDKTYAEIKVDTHEHDFDNSGKCIRDNCGAQKADYSEYFEALERYYALTGEYADILVEKTGDYIEGKVQEIVDEYLGDEEISGNFSVEKQYIIDGIADGVNEICDTIEKGIADGTLIIADYTEIDEAIKAIDEALENATISDEMAAELSDIKAQLEELKEDENATMADVNELLERTETITEVMNNCANGNHTDEDGDYLCDYGCGHEFEKPADTDCDHLCHKDGLLGFFWKLACFFFRLFNLQQYCDCGELHYDAPVFG